MKPVITISFVAVVVFTSLSFTFHSHNPERKHSNTERRFVVEDCFGNAARQCSPPFYCIDSISGPPPLLPACPEQVIATPPLTVP